ncbi:hypothetical protein [Aminipila luticellarii]|uniref:Uncharacterized protein n=1 Tax=Aminipila luticellarii TaxID=2507160 RepID=A0A410PUX8_9FIRM|nr:hypothetical protein [Aminipila luticellarii]QAT42752.1 hypothetical protein EQM06_05635 [Aminipila luticellarii]
MADQIYLHSFRKAVDSTYVGFTPNGGSIKPVHVASGVQRCIYGGYNTTMNIKRLALVSDAKGNVPVGSEIETIYATLAAEETIEDGIVEGSVESMRNVMQRLLSADKGVYVVKGLKDDMISFTAGSKYFLTRTSIYEDTGEFIGGIIRSYCPDLANYIKEVLEKADDPISLLFEPVHESSMQVFEKSRHEDIPVFKNMNNSVKWYVNGIKESGECLMENLKQHPNPLTQLRLFNFYCIFQLIRYMAMLEAFYCEENIRPILLDFSGIAPSQSSVARASEMSYTQMHKSINRFYAWGYAQELKEKDYSKAELLASETPIYEENKKASVELDTLWEMAKERAKVCATDDEARLVFGETMYDMLALEASSHPVNCLKILGTAAGILYPPDKMHPNKRFVLSQDILEMILRSTVSPDEILSGSEMTTRLWERFGIIVGGSTFELERLQNSGMLLQIDEDSLERNFTDFATLLESMDFAEVMADGILQIRLGGAD